MELLKRVILTACFLSTAITIADSVKPGEKFSRQLRLIFSMIFITGTAAAVLSSDISPELPALALDPEPGNYKSVEEAADKAVSSAVSSAAEKSVNDMICRILTAKGISFEKIDVVINMNEDGSIDINEIGYCGSEYEKAAEAVKSGVGDIEVKMIE